jgi:hypothetical protein
MLPSWMDIQITAAAGASSDAGQEDGWVVCRVFKKKHHLKESSGSGGSSKHGHHHHGGGVHGHGSSKAAAHGHGGLQYSSSGDALDQILQYMGRSCKQEHEILSPLGTGGGSAGRAAARYLRPIETVLGGHGFMKLPPLESPSAATTTTTALTTAPMPPHVPGDDLLHRGGNDGITDWAMMDRLVASHLNGQPDHAPADQLCSFDGADDDDAAADGLALYSAAAATRFLGFGASDDDDLWSFARSAAASATERMIG